MKTKKTIIQIEIDTPLVGEQLEESKYEIIVSDPNEDTTQECNSCLRSRIVGVLHRGTGIKIVSVEGQRPKLGDVYGRPR